MSFLKKSRVAHLLKPHESDEGSRQFAYNGAPSYGNSSRSDGQTGEPTQSATRS